MIYLEYIGNKAINTRSFVLNVYKINAFVGMFHHIYQF